VCEARKIPEVETPGFFYGEFMQRRKSFELFRLQHYNYLVNIVYIMKCWLFLVCALTGFVFVNPVMAVDDAPQQEGVVSSVTRSIQGEVVWKTRTKLAVVYYSDDRSEQEMLFLLDGPVKVVHRLSLDDIQVGDTIRVSYEEYVVEQSDGQVIRTRPVEITFIRSGTRTAPVAVDESAATDANTLY
jgi:hypothetical protein